MKKRIVLGLVLLASISMLLSSFARADESPLRTSAQSELMKQNEKDLDDVKSLLKDASDEDSRDLIQARIWDLQQERDQLSTQLD